LCVLDVISKKFQVRIYFFIVVFLCCNIINGQNRYNLSTPKSLVESVGKVGVEPVDENPVPALYTSESAKFIMAYDDTVTSAMNRFREFKKKITTLFPDNVVSAGEEEIELKTGQENTTMKFSVSYPVVRENLKGIKPGDYIFVYSSEFDEGSVRIKTTRNGSETILLARKENGEYRMVLNDATREKFAGYSVYASKYDVFFKKCISAIDNKEINTNNYNQFVSEWRTEFMTILGE
jgi:hypothetical protein